MQQGYLDNRSLVLVFAIFLAVLSKGCDDTGITLPDSFNNDPYVLVLKYQNDGFSTGVSNHVTKSLDYAHIPYLTVDLGIISGEFKIPPSVRSVVITSYEISRLSQEDIGKLVEFVAKGNSIVFTGPFANERFSFLQGVRPDTAYDFDSTNTGYHLNKEVLPGMEGKSFNAPGLISHKGYKARVFKDNVEVLATTATDSTVPFLVSNEIGLGEVITINSYAINNRLYRGIIFSSLLKGLQGIPYRVANVSTIFLDDFPAPLYNEKLPPIDKEYDVTHAEFVSKIWWPDMKALADTFNITYSAMTAFNYNANIVPPFDFQEWQQGSIVYNENVVEGSIFLAQDIRESKHELAFHGYNHFSLWEEDWDNINFMISSLQAARKRWQIDNMGPLPTNYVPPTNQIDSLGIQALIRGMPSIRYMSSLYMGDIEEGGGREFDPEPYAPGELFAYPRISSGFTMTPNSLLDQMGLQLMSGIWTHFIHPDDVFQVSQREGDEFLSRNPLGLGWRSDSEYGYGLYDILVDRIELTKDKFPYNRFVSATRGGEHTQDWRNTLTVYEDKSASILVSTKYRDGYVPNIINSKKHWFIYVEDFHSKETEDVLKKQELTYSRTTLWDGFLYQIETDKPQFFTPNFQKKFYFDQQFLDQMVSDRLSSFNQNYNQTILEFEEWSDTRLEDAVRAWRKTPNDYRVQENLIDLSVEFGQISRAITILENRLLEDPDWAEKDIERLLEYYGWEGRTADAELFLERLWERYKNSAVLDFKNRAVAELGLYGEDFEKRWALRKLQLNPDDYVELLEYTRSIESQENWPEMKSNLRKLLEIRPQNDSLYAFTLQRSFFYESADSTAGLLEEFPQTAYHQLTPFASNLALLYGYDLGDLEKALFWAENAPTFDEGTELFWISQLDLHPLYLAKALSMLNKNPSDDSLRSYIGTNLFYEGYQQESYETLYPLFIANDEGGLAADTLLRNEIGYMSYTQKKDFYKQYPLFYDEDQKEDLISLYRRTEGVRVSSNAEYKDDNFDNTLIRAGSSIQFGNRQDKTHTLKVQNLRFSDVNQQTTTTLNYYGVGYEFSSRWNEQRMQFRTASSFLASSNDFVPEILTAFSFAKDSAFSSIELTAGPELTSSSVLNDYYQAQLQLYRQDFWLNSHISTGLSASSKYFTNNVFRYSGTLRVFLESMRSRFRLKPGVDISYSDATTNYPSGIPFYTPDQYFAQGAGFIFEYTDTITSEYNTRVSGEVFGKRERREGYFLSARAQVEHTFDNFWSVSLGSEVSTSRVYRSNRIFFRVSYYFPKDLLNN